MPRSARAPVPSIRWFQEFAAELIALRDSARIATVPQPADLAPGDLAAPVQGQAVSVATTHAAATAAAVAVELAPDPMQARPSAIRNRLVTILDRQIAGASRIAGPVGIEFHREAIYVMASLADEVFIRLDWEGRAFWLRNLLEAHYFGSHFAGERFFQRADQVMARSDDPAAETATVYLMALSLGFRGKYYGQSGDRFITDYSTRLFFFIASRDPEMTEAARLLFPAAYRNTIQGGAPRRFSNVRRWWIALIVILVAWVVAAHFIWGSLSGPLLQNLTCVEQNKAVCTAP